MKKSIWILFCIFCLWCAGNFVYIRSDWYQQGYSSRNPYLNEQIEMCLVLDAINGEKMVIAQEDFLPIVRQVSGEIKLLYGLDIQKEGNYDSEVVSVYEAMSADSIDMNFLLKKATDLGADYLILTPNWDIISKSLSELQEEKKLTVVYETRHYSLVKL